MELAYLSALLERLQNGHQSKRFKAIETFFKSAVSVVPLESLFHAIVNGKYNVVLQCCEILCSSDTRLTETHLSEFFLASVDRVLRHISHLQQVIVAANHYLIDGQKKSDYKELFEFELTQIPITKRNEHYELLSNTYSRILQLVPRRSRRDGRHQYSPCDIDLEVIYPSAEVKGTRNSNEKCRKAPINLLTEGRNELSRLSEELIAEHSGFTEESRTSNTNVKMLSVLTHFREKFETCSTLLGAFMESQVQIPLEKAGGDKYVNKFAKHASSIGLSAWGLLILPFKYLNRLVTSNISEDFRTFVVEFSRHIHGMRNHVYPPSGQQFPDYDERLEFLVGSMKQSWACNQQYVSYSLERQLEDQCKKRSIYHYTSVDEILDQWNANFEDETLTLVPNEYRRLVARWIKWSLMINHLREILASQTAVGVIGLVNSGKSKFVRSLFGKDVSDYNTRT